MAIKLKYYNIIIPIAILAKYEKISNRSGILDFYANKGKLKSVWHDDHLITVGGIMSPGDVEKEVLILEKLGLTPFEEKSGQKLWKDLCVASFLEGPTLSCSWIRTEVNPFNVEMSCAWLKGKEKGEIVGPNL